MNTPSLEFRLLDHPFYQAWTNGDISKEQLSEYGQSYLQLIKKVPYFWQKIITAFGDTSQMGKQVVQEEKEHIDLWEKWIDKMEKPTNFPQLSHQIEVLEKMSASELLGALQSFEIQQPEVAKTKKDGLIDHYNFLTNDLQYFDEHMAEEEHIQFGHNLAIENANLEEFKTGFKKGSKMFYDALDLFLSEPKKHVSC